MTIPIDTATPVAGLIGLSTRARNCLREAGIETIDDLITLRRKSPAELLRLPNFGKATLAEIDRALAPFMAELHEEAFLDWCRANRRVLEILRKGLVR